MNKFLSLLFAIYFFASCAVLACIAVPLCFITSPFDKNRRWLHYFSCAWGYHYIFFSPFWSGKIKGREKIDRKSTYIYVANHQSYFDIFILYGLFTPYKWVSKEEMFKMPFVGDNLKRNQYVCFKRGSMSSIKEMFNDCRKWIEQGTSIMLFPEGTRSETGEIARFRDGAFRLALDCKIPVVPIVINGSYEVFSRHAKEMKFNIPITAQILDPIDPSKFENAPALRDYTETLMKEKLAEMRKL